MYSVCVLFCAVGRLGMRLSPFEQLYWLSDHSTFSCFVRLYPAKHSSQDRMEGQSNNVLINNIGFGKGWLCLGCFMMLL